MLHRPFTVTALRNSGTASPNKFGLRLPSRVPALKAEGVPEAPEFPMFSKFKNNITAQHPNLFRLDCMKPFIAVSHFLARQPLFQAPYDKDVENSLKTVWVLRTGASDTAHITLTKGVRDGLFLSLLSLRDTCDEVVWPCDIYPVYGRII